MAAKPHDLGIVRDDAEALGAAVDRARALPADILVTLGGASVGEHDLVRDALAGKGMALDFWKIAMRPGKPLMFGRSIAGRWPAAGPRPAGQPGVEPCLRDPVFEAADRRAPRRTTTRDLSEPGVLGG